MVILLWPCMTHTGLVWGAEPTPPTFMLPWMYAPPLDTHTVLVLGAELVPPAILLLPGCVSCGGGGMMPYRVDSRGGGAGDAHPVALR